jgi:hypothetical protein
MTRGMLLILATGSLALLLSGCSPDGASSVTLAEGGGVVTFKGAPLPDATVTFIPDQGPIASGVTDLSGKFKLMTGARPGVVVGTCKVTVSSYTGGAAGATATNVGGPVTSREEGERRKAEMEKMFQKMSKPGEGSTQDVVIGAGSKSVIPERYTKSDTSDLKYTVEKDASKNDFKIELKE